MKVSATVDFEVFKELTWTAQAHGVTRSELIKEILIDYIKNEKAGKVSFYLQDYFDKKKSQVISKKKKRKRRVGESKRSYDLRLR